MLYSDRKIPCLVWSMKPDELDEFKVWLAECCGIEYDTATERELSDGAELFYDEQFQAANEEYFAREA